MGIPIGILLFWLALMALVTAHVAVPIGLRLLRPRSSRPHRPPAKSQAPPSVSVIVSAYNEERHVAAKIADCLRFEHPRDRLEIIVISDGSTDGTNAILQGVTDPRVRALFIPDRLGKTHAQNRGAEHAHSDVLFFTDATTRHPPDVLERLLPGLDEPEVGCVTGRPVYRSDEGTVSRGADRRLEMEMGSRDALGAIYSLLGAQDCIYSVRRTLYRPVPDHLDGGLAGPLLLLEQGLRTVYRPDALAYVDRPAPDLRSEFLRRTRIVLGGLRVLIELRRLLNPFRHPALALALVATRLLRWLTPLFLGLLLVANLFLLDLPFYRLTLGLQALFYADGAVGLLLRHRLPRMPSLLTLPSYFCLLSAAAAAAIWRLLQGETAQTWDTVRANGRSRTL